MEELTEVITAAEFHPLSCNLFSYSSSKGTVKLADMREQALCDKHAKRASVSPLPLFFSLASLRLRAPMLIRALAPAPAPRAVFEEEEDPSSKSFFSEIISSVSDVKFSKDGRYLLSRDYLTLRIWDINMENKPVQTINVHDHLRSKLCDLYENDCIFDKFECTFSGDGKCVGRPSLSPFLSLSARVKLTTGPRPSRRRAGASSPGRTTTTSTSTTRRGRKTLSSRPTSLPSRPRSSAAKARPRAGRGRPPMARRARTAATGRRARGRRSPSLIPTTSTSTRRSCMRVGTRARTRCVLLPLPSFRGVSLPLPSRSRLSAKRGSPPAPSSSRTQIAIAATNNLYIWGHGSRSNDATPPTQRTDPS